ncbi:MAG: hypothetical protein QM784_08645 [Polyangiaceae bacterium]
MAPSVDTIGTDESTIPPLAARLKPHWDGKHHAGDASELEKLVCVTVELVFENR